MNLFRYCQSIVYFDPQIPDRAFGLGSIARSLIPDIQCNGIGRLLTYISTPRCCTIL
jgi:hypothetical protein